MKITPRGVALVAVNAIVAAALVVLIARHGDGGSTPLDPTGEVTVTGTVAAAWYPKGRVVLADDGTAYTLDARTEAAIGAPRTRVTVTGHLGPSRTGAEDVPGLDVVGISTSAVTSTPGAIANPVPATATGDMTLKGLAPGTQLRIDGYVVARADGDGRLTWDSTTVRDGVHMAALLRTRGDRVVARRTGWLTVTNGDGPPATPPGRPLFTGDFETGDLSQWGVVQAVGSHSVRVVSDTRRQGRYAARFEVRQGDDPINSTGDRSELSRDTGESEGADRWYAFDLMVPASFPRLDTWQVLAQWHSSEDGSPPLGVYAQNDELVLQVNPHDAPGEPLEAVFPWRGPLKRGRWREIVMHVVWSGSDERGRISLWVDGVSVVRDRPGRTLYPGFPNYTKIGYYRDSEARPVGVVYHDGFRITEVTGGDDG